MKAWFVLLCALGIASALVAGCGGSKKEASQSITLGSLAFSDHGTKDASAVSSLSLEIDDFYFSPSFIKGKPGESLKLSLANDSNSLHNLSIAAIGVDQDIQPKGKAEVTVTFPQSGVLLFLCKYHTGQGMNGELLAGDATPQAAAAAAATIKVATSPALGQILTDGAGLTLYLNKNDVVGSGKSIVNGNLATAWPPLVLATGSPVKPSGLSGDLTLITRDDGTKQVAYKGQPLYRYSRDTNAGDANGQAVGNVWFVVAP
jgi:predicted lipoprotein with Yx(FWY)xxD motif